jgi:hypothetical protein
MTANGNGAAMAITKIGGDIPPPGVNKCANCEGTIGRLETPHIWRKQVVCAQCFLRLNVSSMPPQPKPAERQGPPTMQDIEGLQYESPEPRPLADIQKLEEPAAHYAAAQHIASNRCPKCASTDTASLRAIYERGTSQWSGGTVGIAGNDLFFGGSGGTSISQAAQRASPPFRKDATAHILSLCAALALLVFGVVLICSAPRQEYYNPRVKPDPPSAQIPFGYLLLASGVAWIVIAIVCIRNIGRWNSREYVQRFGVWNRRWMCQRCSTIFEREA